MLVIAEDDLRLLDFSVLLDINVFRSVDHDVADLVVLQEQLERPESERLVEDLVDQTLPLVAIQERVLGVAELLDQAPDFVAQRLGIDLADPLNIEAIDQSHVDVTLEHLVLFLGGVDFLGRLAPPSRARAEGGNGRRPPVASAPAGIGRVSAPAPVPGPTGARGPNGLRPNPRNIRHELRNNKVVIIDAHRSDRAHD